MLITLTFMNIIHIFENSGEQINNDVVLPGSPFRVDFISYNFNLKPECEYWRFGIRLSKSFKIDFYMPEHRYKLPEFDEHYIDIHIGVGQWDGSIWKDNDKIHLAQYNIPDNDHYLSEQSYKPLTQIAWSLHFDTELNRVQTYIELKDDLTNKLLVYDLQLPGDFKFFKVFAWADRSPFRINCEISIPPYSTDISSSNFKVGNILFRKGDMFDYANQKMANVFVLPASASGTATPHTLNKAAELGIPQPEMRPAGTVDLYSIPGSNEWMRAGYGYSTSGDISHPDIIAQIAMNLHDITMDNEEMKNNCRAVSLPLLGTGAGELDVVEVASIFDRIFNQNDVISYVISVLDKSNFLKVKRSFAGRYQNLDEEKVEVAIPADIVELSTMLSIELQNVRFVVDENGKISDLTIMDSAFVSPQNWLTMYESITSLSFVNCKFDNLNFITQFTYLRSLGLTACQIRNVDAIALRRDLLSLEISDLNEVSISFLRYMTSLRRLALRNVSLTSIHDISRMPDLDFLDLRSNKLEILKGIGRLKNLKKLFLPNNRIKTIEEIKNLKNLEVLVLSDNSINDLTPIVALKNLSYLRVNRNPAIANEKIILHETENHLLPVLNMLQKKADADLVEVRLPCKILLLGNHGTGKSSLLNLIQNREDVTPNSTHIINIEKYPLSENGMPKAIFFDFGGQDYYHGLYNAFFSGGSFYILLFNLTSNINKRQTDSNGILTQDFSLQYWLSQKRYFEQQVSLRGRDPIFVVQTYSDRDSRLTKINVLEGIDESHYVTLIDNGNNDVITYKRKQNENNLRHLIQAINDYIDFASEVVKRPRWFVRFIERILKMSVTSTHEAVKIDDLLHFYERPGSAKQVKAFMQDDLDQLHQQGLVLYFKTHLPDFVWLNPVAVVKYVHDHILVKSKLGNNSGIFLDDVQKFDSNVIRLLDLQKVIFFHDYGKRPHYIIPNFLHLFEEEVSGAELLMFGFDKPCLVLKFVDFIPFGLVNQLICFFGLLPESKRFWRDKLIFKIENCKVNIDVDMQLLEIKIYIVSGSALPNESFDSVIRYVFFSIVGQYWNLSIPSYNDYVELEAGAIDKISLPYEDSLHQKILNLEALLDNTNCRPLDLFLSIDFENFISYTKLCASEGAYSISALKRESKTGELDDHGSIVDAYPFRLFTKANLKRSFKAVISYSKQDIDHVLKFRQYLEPLKEQGLLDQNWFCTLLLAGTEWDKKIQKEFDEADVIFFMISENLMSTSYVKDHEIKNAIDRYDRDKEVLIIPILLVPYNFKGKGKYDLTRFSSLPYSLKPISEFRSQHMGWHIVSELIRITLERKLRPERTNDPFYSQLERYLSAVINGEKIHEKDQL